MKILSIETSCDETAISIVEVIEAAPSDKSASKAYFRILADVLISQTSLHEKYGGVFPMLAKREHAKNLTPLLHKALLKASMLKELPSKINSSIRTLLSKENDLANYLIQFLENYEQPDIDMIAVTSGPGLEPALWVGISFAKALGLAWNKPIVPVNHMEGHIIAALLPAVPTEKENQPLTLRPLSFPALALLISGGHTELVHMRDWRQYQLLGQTRDDAVGEAFDKVARLLGLPYPGGPQISKLAEKVRSEELGMENKNHDTQNRNIQKQRPFKLPRPMIDSGDFDFSFSGLKTAVLYALKGQNGLEVNKNEMDTMIAQKMAREFEDAVTDTLIAKTEAAIEHVDAQCLIIGGGVIANIHIRQAFEEMARRRGISLLLPQPRLTTDNALMIALAGYFVHTQGKVAIFEDRFATVIAEGNLSL
jgi:N6-L-threonylcarbamoyladenine synthase